MAIPRRLIRGARAACLGLFAALPALAQSDPAFPGAEGYGAGATGWRGGALIAVTTLADHGPGSLRACAEAEGPRLCIFRVAGTITLSAPIMLRSNLYLAGQTAPGRGIQLRLGRSSHGPLIVKNAHDVVIRFLKLRPGTGGGRSPTIDALTLENAQRVYLGNLSMAYASDETFNIHVSGGVSADITLADSILAYSLDRANHPKGKHSKGALICSDEGTGNGCGRISLLRNLFAHHRDRNPDVKATDLGPVEIVNNLFYNPISQFGEFYDLLGDARIAYRGNLALTGPSSTARAGAAVEGFDWSEDHGLWIDARGNLAQSWAGCRSRAPLPVLDEAAAAMAPDRPIALSLAPMPADQLERVLPGRVGDTLPDGSHRDALDLRVLEDLAQCRGAVIDRPEQAGGWPLIGAADPPPDRDGDLFPDAWEEGRPALDPDHPDDPWGDSDGDGLSEVETWLAALAGDG